LGEDDARGKGSAWTQHGKVRARALPGGGIEVQVDSLTTQAKYYKPLLKEFFRLHFPVRPRWGDWSAEIRMEFTGEPPHMDLDNLAKAMLDSAVGAAFHDDSQVARLLAERKTAAREGVWMRLTPL
jgi:crossover junction endodeoxyribonuclease RusA